MGTDIYCYAERRTAAGWEPILGLEPFDWRSYGMFGFLADVRNYSAVPPIAARRGFPEDASPEVRREYDGDGRCPSWLSVDELLAFDYDAPVEDRRAARDGDGGCTCAPGEGEMTTFRAFLGEAFFRDLEALRAAGAGRVVFWFD